MTQPKLLMIPGYTGSGEEHWQTIWERTLPNAARIEQADFDRPGRASWLDRITRDVATYRGDVVLIGHSLGALAIVHWAASGIAIRGALLVAPPDLDKPNLIPQLRGWSPMPIVPLPFAGIVVASSDDSWVTLERARAFAKAWQSEFVDAGPIGHIDSASHIGAWPQGQLS